MVESPAEVRRDIRGVTLELPLGKHTPTRGYDEKIDRSLFDGARRTKIGVPQMQIDDGRGGTAAIVSGPGPKGVIEAVSRDAHMAFIGRHDRLSVLSGHIERDVVAQLSASFVGLSRGEQPGEVSLLTFLNGQTRLAISPKEMHGLKLGIEDSDLVLPQASLRQQAVMAARKQFVADLMKVISDRVVAFLSHIGDIEGFEVEGVATVATYSDGRRVSHKNLSIRDIGSLVYPYLTIKQHDEPAPAPPQYTLELLRWGAPQSDSKEPRPEIEAARIDSVRKRPV